MTQWLVDGRLGVWFHWGILSASIELMGSSETIKWKRSADALTIQRPRTLLGKIVNGFRIYSKWGGMNEYHKKSYGKISYLRLLGSDKRMRWIQTAQALEIDFTGIETGANGYAIEVTLKQ